MLSTSFLPHLFLVSSQMLPLLQLPQLTNPPLFLHPYSEKLSIPLETPMFLIYIFELGVCIIYYTELKRTVYMCVYIYTHMYVYIYIIYGYILLTKSID